VTSSICNYLQVANAFLKCFSVMARPLINAEHRPTGDRANVATDEQDYCEV